MTKHRVEQGECLSSIARQYGFSDYRGIYDHPDNASFKQKRPNPNLIYPGDEFWIPEKELRHEDAVTEKRHRFQVESRKTMLRMRLKDEQDKPIAHAKYILEVEQLEFTGSTDANGELSHKTAPDAKDGRLRVFLKHNGVEEVFTWRLGIGQLDPVTEISGVQARLSNLGFEAGPVDGQNGPLTRAAVRQFQAHYKLQVDGIVGPETRGKLEQVYGC
jgi:N-acetylmuramoyl-L-alanine amidase